MRMFSGIRDGALGKCGDLCMRNDEFAKFRTLTHHEIEFFASTGPMIDIKGEYINKIMALPIGPGGLLTDIRDTLLFLLRYQ